MRVAYLCTDRGVTLGGAKGAAVHMAEIVSALARSRADVLLLPRSIAQEWETPTGVLVKPLPPAVRDADLAGWLEVRLRSFGATAVYERFALHSTAGGTAARRVRIPHAVELNAPLPLEAARYRTLPRPDEAARLERAVLSRADAVLAVSGPLARYARSRGARRVEVLPNAVDMRRFPERPAPSESRCVFLGALRPWHGIAAIADAWRLLGAEAPPLLVVGDGPERAVLEAVGAEVTGAVPHARVPELLATATIGLAPYASDAPGYFSPLKLFEYLAAGLAVVTGDIPGVREAVRPEQAVLIRPGDARALAAAVLDLAQDDSKQARLGAAGRAHVAAHHTWDARAVRILDLLAELRPALVA